MAKPYRNKKIARYIHDNLVCCITGAPNPDPHHIIGHGFSVMGSKAPDYLQMPLCHRLHRELHDKGWKAFEAKYEVCQKVLVTETLLNLQDHKVINCDEIDLPDWFHYLKDFFNE